MSAPVDSVLPTGPRLQGRRIIVTGAASGMGRAIAELFAAEGAALALFDIQEGPLQQVASATGSTAITVDLGSAQSIRDGVAAAEQALGGIDGIVNAAGILKVMMLADTDEATWRRVHDVNLLAPHLVCTAALAALRRNDEATIVNIASSGGITVPPGMGSYGASKAGLIALTQGQALEWAPKIRSNAIAPGVIRTAMLDVVWPDQTTGEEMVKHGNGQQRMGTPMEIAYLALFLTSRESSFISGTVHLIDGGRPMPS